MDVCNLITSFRRKFCLLPLKSQLTLFSGQQCSSEFHLEICIFLLSVRQLCMMACVSLSHEIILNQMDKNYV